MNVYLIRHGQTHGNVNRQFAGSWDVDLTETGALQAKRVGERLKDSGFKAIYSSDLIRARRTAEAIAAHHGLVPQVMKGLREMDFGLWEQRTIMDIQKTDGEKLNAWLQNFRSFRAPEGESVDELVERTVAAYTSILEGYDRDSDDAICIVAHGGVIQALLSYICYGDATGYWRFGIDNCGINRIEYVMGYPVIKAINQ